MYFIVTTATTVGYGDFYAWNTREKVFMIFLEFSAICTFSLIIGQFTNLKDIDEISEVIERKVSV